MITGKENRRDATPQNNNHRFQQTPCKNLFEIISRQINNEPRLHDMSSISHSHSKGLQFLLPKLTFTFWTSEI